MEANNATGSLTIGRKIEGIPRLKKMTQAGLGDALGISKQAVSKMEQASQMNDDRLQAVAKALGVSSDVIQNFNGQTAINIISSTLHDNSGSVFYNPTFNPLDKIVELYERMLKEKDDLIDKLMREKS